MKTERTGTTFSRASLFYASCIALIVTSMTFAVRAELEPVFAAKLTPEELGFAFVPAF